MSTPSEKVAAQRRAFKARGKKPWSRHLIGPVELECLLSDLAQAAERRDALLAKLREIHEITAPK